MRACYGLWWREVIRFVRQRKRMIAVIAQPFIFWLLIGYCFKSSYQSMSYMEYLLPGAIAMVTLFTSIFASFSTIEDRAQGFLQAVLVAPISSTSLILGKILGGATIATFQAMLFLVIAPFFGISVIWGNLPHLFGAIALSSLAVTAMGFYFAWGKTSSSEFHDVMMLLFLPMWFLSGALFKIDQVPWIFQKVIELNPLTYSVALIRQSLYGAQPTIGVVPSIYLCWGVTFAFGVLFLFLSAHKVKHARF